MAFSNLNIFESDRLRYLTDEVMDFPEMEELARFKIAVDTVYSNDLPEELGKIVIATDYERLKCNVDVVIYISTDNTQEYNDSDLKSLIMHLVSCVDLTFNESGYYLKKKKNAYHEINIDVLKRFGKMTKPYDRLFAIIDKEKIGDIPVQSEKTYRPMCNY